MKSRILLLSFYYMPDLCAGSFRASAMVTALLKALPPNVEIDVVTTLPNRYASYSNLAAHQVSMIDTQAQYSIHRIALPKHESGMLDQAKAFCIFAKEALKISKLKKYDLIVATSSRLMTASLAAYIAKRTRTPLYLDIRDIFVDTVKDVITNKLLFWLPLLLASVEKLTINQATRVNLVSDGFLPYFQNRYPRQQYSCFTNGIDQDFMNVMPAKSTHKNRDKNGLLHILYAGNIGEGQGLHRIVPSLANALKNKVRFTIIGDGGRFQQLKAAIQSERCSNVDLMPPMNREQLIEAYLDADVLFLHVNNFPAFEKVLPSKIFEYAALGKPVLAGVAGYPAQFILNEIENAEVFTPCNVLDAVAALQRLDLHSRIRAEFLKKFSRTNIMNAMALDILSLLPRPTHDKGEC